MTGVDSPVYICSYRSCGRVVTYADDEILDWLIALRVDNPAKLVIRCPQHITERTLRYAGRRRTYTMYRWARDNRIKDMRRKSIKILPPGAIIPVSLESLAHGITNPGRVHSFKKYRIVQKKKPRIRRKKK